MHSATNGALLAEVTSFKAHILQAQLYKDTNFCFIVEDCLEQSGSRLNLFDIAEQEILAFVQYRKKALDLIAIDRFVVISFADEVLVYNFEADGFGLEKPVLDKPIKIAIEQRGRVAAALKSQELVVIGPSEEKAGHLKVVKISYGSQ